MLLPPELIDRILSFLWGDTLALQACSKAHPLAERHLYASIVVDPPGVTELHKQLSENSRLLDYPRTLEICDFGLTGNPQPVLSIMRMIPRMVNIISLRISGFPLPFPCSSDDYNEFISAFTNCLQQSSIEQLDLSHLYAFPFYILDNGKNIKKLMLSDCTANEESKSIPNSPSCQSLETLILRGHRNPDLHIWAIRQITRLTSLRLGGLLLNDNLKWTLVPRLLTTCSDSLTSLHLEIGGLLTSARSYEPVDQIGHWINTVVPFTFSALTHLKNLCILTPIIGNATEIDCGLPEIIRLTQTAPAIEHVILGFHYFLSGCITTIRQMDWSLLDRLQSTFTGTRPRVDLHISGESVVGRPFSPESILDALARNEVLMDLVKRGSVNLKSERRLALWDEPF